MTIGNAPVETRDFANFWLAARGALSNINIYNLEALRAFGATLLGTTFSYDFPYPPHALFLFLPFAWLPLKPAFLAWDLFSAVLFFLAARPYMPKGLPAILAIISPAALINANFGQTGLVGGSLFLFAFKGIGLAAAALTFKPHLGILLIPRLLGDRKALTTAIIGTAILAVSSAMLFGGWFDFPQHVRESQGDMLIERSAFSWLLLGTTPMIGYGVWGWVLFAAGGLYFVARCYNVFTAGTATFLISPYGFHYDMAVVCLGFGILLFTFWEEMPPWHRTAASLGFLSPVLVGLGTWLVPPILLVGLLVQTEWMDGGSLRVSRMQAGRLRFRLDVIRSRDPDVTRHGYTSPVRT
jgi:hypothetical protein